MSDIFDAILRGECNDPHAFLGAHPTSRGVVVRTFQPGATSATLVLDDGTRHVMWSRRPGLFEVEISGASMPLRYTFAFVGDTGPWNTGDPYRFLPTVPEADVRRFNEGTHHRAWELLGAHPMTVDGEPGVSFSVWAPNARGVSLIGDFNAWQAGVMPMRTLGSTGVWELFVPGLGPGERYKFAVQGADGVRRDKSDPFGRRFELRPASATIVDEQTFRWGDDEWMARRRNADPLHEPMAAYELHLGSWRQKPDGSWYTYREIAQELVPYLQRMGYTHIELLPLCEHPYDGSWGYQVTGFFAPTSRFGTPDDLRAFIDALHRGGIGVIMDWVPAHFATDEYALTHFDGTAQYEHEDWRKRIQPDWGTFAFNYGRHEVKSFLLSSAMCWVEDFHIDGLRVDAVSSMVYLDYSRSEGEWAPNMYGGREHLEAVDFLKAFNEVIYGESSGAITIAEESTAWPAVSHPTYAGGLGFGFKWNMGWMHDTLMYMSRDPIYRRYHQGTLTFSMIYAYSENYVLSLSHDEVVHGKASLLHKMPGDEWQQFANLRLLYGYQYAFPGKKLNFMGSEFGQRHEWDHDTQLEWQALDHPPHRGVQDLVAELNRLHREYPALHALDHDSEGFSWLDYADAAQLVIAFARHSGDPADDLICVMNFTPLVHENYRIPVTGPGAYREVLNTDDARWGGSGDANSPVTAEAEPFVGRDYSMLVTLPPLAAVDFERVQPE
ncbi:MAG: 1,4-alpha-glucan branching protein GlgB [Dehalococcoidia bacterium]|nr:1,4-alpha-glucan branching protein GlgB [Dehalococcoidia bacterium]